MLAIWLLSSTPGEALELLNSDADGPADAAAVAADNLLSYDFESRGSLKELHQRISPVSAPTGPDRPSLSPVFPVLNGGEPHTAFAEPVPPRDNSTLTLGYLVVDRGRAYVAFRGWKVVSGALSYAIEKINSEGIVPGYNLTYVIRDIRGLTNDSLMEMSRLWRDGVVGFIGPANTCKNEALLAAAWNLPILSHVSVSVVSSCHLERCRLKRECFF